jgi:hypothetical protein
MQSSKGAKRQRNKGPERIVLKVIFKNTALVLKNIRFNPYAAYASLLLCMKDIRICFSCKGAKRQRNKRPERIFLKVIFKNTALVLKNIRFNPYAAYASLLLCMKNKPS